MGPEVRCVNLRIMRIPLKSAGQQTDIPEEMAHLSENPRNRIARSAQSTVWLGATIAGLSVASLALFYAYAVLSNIFSAGASFDGSQAVTISAIGLATGVAMSLIGFAVGIRTQHGLSSEPRGNETIAA